MKRFIRIFVVEVVVLYFVSQIAGGLIFENGNISLVITAIALAIASLTVKPVINLLLLPLNLLTFGLFRWLGGAITLFLVDLVLNQFRIADFFLRGYKSDLIVIPSLHLPAGVLSYLAFSFLISFITTIIYWLVV